MRELGRAAPASTTRWGPSSAAPGPGTCGSWPTFWSGQPSWRRGNAWARRIFVVGRRQGRTRPQPPRTMAEMEEAAIREALEAAGGHRKKAAEALGIGERTLYDKLKQYGIR